MWISTPSNLWTILWATYRPSYPQVQNIRPWELPTATFLRWHLHLRTFLTSSQSLLLLLDLHLLVLRRERGCELGMASVHRNRTLREDVHETRMLAKAKPLTAENEVK